MREEIVKWEKGDINGSIKFFREVIKGFESWVNEDIIESSNCVEALKKFLKMTSHLLSNFSEHAGTSGLMNEGILSKEITISVLKYLLAKMKE